MEDRNLTQAYEHAKEVYGGLGVDVEKAMALADGIAISMHSWQGDDLIGFDGSQELSGGIASTGNYIGRARTLPELLADLDEAMGMIPGKLKVSVHACQADLGGKKIGRDAYTVQHFSGWIDWAKERKIGLDFNPTFFSSPQMDGDFSLSSFDDNKRKFWIEHGKRCREIGEAFGRMLGIRSLVNYWMPDGYKDIPADTAARRELMVQSLDEIFSAPMDKTCVAEALESKLFGLGLESYTAASHEFSLGYAITRKKIYTMDAGHFHPTERISAKFSAVLQYLDEILLHVSRGVRWDSDHVVIWDEELQSMMNEIIFNGYPDRVNIGLDFFDASINRIACWVIGTRNTRKALLSAALNPIHLAKDAERRGDYTARLAYLEEAKTLPFSAVWDYYCARQGVPVGTEWIARMKQYEKVVLSTRG
ncbi:L-rhamnose isomerase [Marasmitruncus massiliensis]|uniref:L-rhamnose isomerase n=1 Tax=Marasmitruncus massiliensis TaxID=1944642 RepID=UPI000C79C792|nr:L-rhamnose isomerase [Marasmitruncus massiliensis]